MSGKKSFKTEKPSVALVLSGGGSRGLAHIGVIEILLENGFRITSVAGSSIGALIGGIYAMGCLQVYKDWVCSLNKKDIWELIDFAFSSKGLIKGKRIFDRMRSFIPDRNIEDFPIPFTAVATDVINQQQIEFRSGSFYEAVRASIAIPAIFTPVKFKNTFLVDGGIINPLPISSVERTGNDILVAVNLYGKNPEDIKLTLSKITSSKKESKSKMFNLFSKLVVQGDPKSPGYYSLLNFSLTTLIQQLTYSIIDKYQPDILIEIPCQLASIFDFHRAQELVDIGRKKTEEILSNFLAFSD